MSEAVILVPLDGSEQALAALPVAKVLGEIERAALRIVHVSERRPVSAELLKLEVPDGSTVDARTGEPAAEILLAAGEMKPRLIVMCTHTAAKPGRTLGSTATNVLRNAPCPVVLVPPGRGSIAWHLHHVLVPHDGTPTTSAALRPAAELAEWPAWTREFVKRLECICPLGHLHVRMVLAHGNPAAEIVRLAKKQAADLMVLAWRGKWEVPRAMTLKDILREAQCPIMVVRA